MSLRIACFLAGKGEPEEPHLQGRKNRPLWINPQTPSLLAGVRSSATDLSAVKLCAEKVEAEIESQRTIISTGMANGADAAEAEKLLTSLELDLQTHLAEVDEILDFLDSLPLVEDEVS